MTHSSAFLFLFDADKNAFKEKQQNFTTASHLCRETQPAFLIDPVQVHESKAPLAEQNTVTDLKYGAKMRSCCLAVSKSVVVVFSPPPDVLTKAMEKCTLQREPLHRSSSIHVGGVCISA